MTNAPIDWTGQKKISLALQGGGSHGAFTWGVLDAILEDGRLDIEAITGTSAGAMNAVVFAEGYLEGGREGARKSLARFWRSISDEGAFTPAQQKFVHLFFQDWPLQANLAYWWADFLTHYSSPYDFNPLNINPLRDHLVKMIDFEKVRACEELKLFVSATNVHTGRIAVFERARTHRRSCDGLGLPAVPVSGGRDRRRCPIGTAAIWAIRRCFRCSTRPTAPDILIVQINPIERNELPKTARDIQDRLNEITFNGALMGEFRAMDFVNRLIDEGRLSGDEYMRTRPHRIEGGKLLASFAASTKARASWTMIEQLHDFGRIAAQEWLAANYDKIGVEGTLDLRMAYK